MSESVYKIIELVGTSEESWEKAATAAVNLLLFLVHSSIKAIQKQKKPKQFNKIYMGKSENLNILGIRPTTGI